MEGTPMSKNNFFLGLNRRGFLGIGATTAAATTLSCVAQGMPSLGSEIPKARIGFRTTLCDLLGIEYPVLQAGMSGVATPELVAAVSGAGGLGILTGTLLAPEELRNRIRQVRKLTDRPFGVNLLLHTDLRPPVDVKRIPESTVHAVQEMLNRFRERLSLQRTQARPASIPDLLDATFEVILEERVPIFSIGLGNPTSEMIRRCHERGIKVIAMVATVEDARQVMASGVDAIVAQGGEAGGHRSTLGETRIA